MHAQKVPNGYSEPGKVMSNCEPSLTEADSQLGIVRNYFCMYPSFVLVCWIQRPMLERVPSLSLLAKNREAKLQGVLRRRTV